MNILLQSGKLLFRGSYVYRGLDKRDEFHFTASHDNVTKMMGLIAGAICIDDCYHWLVQEPVEYPSLKDKEWHEAQAKDPWSQVDTMLEKTKEEQYEAGRFDMPLFRATDSGAASS